MWRAEHAVPMEVVRNGYRILFGKPEGKRSFIRHKHRWENDMQLYLPDLISHLQGLILQYLVLQHFFCILHWRTQRLVSRWPIQAVVKMCDWHTRKVKMILKEIGLVGVDRMFTNPFLCWNASAITHSMQFHMVGILHLYYQRSK